MIGVCLTGLTNTGIVTCSVVVFWFVGTKGLVLISVTTGLFWVVTSVEFVSYVGFVNCVGTVVLFSCLLLLT